MVKETLLKQAWWVSLAFVLAGLQAIFAVGIGLDSEASATERIVVFSVWVGGAVLAILGARLRLRNPRGGDALLALGVVPAVITGIIAFWFPPMWLTTAAGLAVFVSATHDAITGPAREVLLSR